MNAPDPTTFPAPNQYATYIPRRTTHFKTHSALSLAKSAVTGATRRGGSYRNGKYEYALSEAWVYKYNADAEAWEEIAHVPDGAFRDELPLWQVPAKSGRKVSDKQVKRAIDSIMATAAQGD